MTAPASTAGMMCKPSAQERDGQSVAVLKPGGVLPCLSTDTEEDLVKDVGDIAATALDLASRAAAQYL